MIMLYRNKNNQYFNFEDWNHVIEGPLYYDQEHFSTGILLPTVQCAVIGQLAD